ncbi:uS10/mL48 family ribosomal protein [Haladaptatus caseinilyticus]|uniref:uS10/mL48 family ribosomal protein n=1 Tax=Haladaptatus caseinilyticus TaxID=2993314 RepID=UPI00224B1385|nr:uS10/mL48 family ribosomal protein [Haladaptatus caseinilyticus]
MTFITKILLQSGNRPVLDKVVSEIRSTAERKGADLRGPHSEPPERIRVPQYKTLSGDEGRQFRSWDYTVYTRKVEIVGHNGVSRQVAEMDFPPGIRVEVELEQIQGMGKA